MPDDVRRIGTGDLRDEGQQPVPERERVARVQAPVRELVQRVERQVAEVGELARPREVEEAVAAHLAGDVPEEDAEQDAARRSRRRPRDDAAGAPPPAARAEAPQRRFRAAGRGSA